MRRKSIICIIHFFSFSKGFLIPFSVPVFLLKYFVKIESETKAGRMICGKRLHWFSHILLKRSFPFDAVQLVFIVPRCNRNVGQDVTGRRKVNGNSICKNK